MFKYKIKGDRKMKEETREKIQDKEDKTPLQPHNFFTLELIRRKLITEDSEFDLYLWDALFQEMLHHFEFRTVLTCTGYTISCIKRNNFKDEEGKKIECLYAYFKVALLANIKKYMGLIHIDWVDY